MAEKREEEEDNKVKNEAYEEEEEAEEKSKSTLRKINFTKTLREGGAGSCREQKKVKCVMF